MERRKREEGRGKKEEGRRKREEGKGKRKHHQFCKKHFIIIVRASPLAYCTPRERGRSHKCKTERLPDKNDQLPITYYYDVR